MSKMYYSRIMGIPVMLFFILTVTFFLTGGVSVLFPQSVNYVRTPLPISWQKSLNTGGLDPNDVEICATEIRQFAVFDGKLYAAGGVWMDELIWDSVLHPDLPVSQIYVLDRSEKLGGQWTVDKSFTGKINKPGQTTHDRTRFIAVSTLETVNFTTDYQGNPLSSDVSLLLASCWDYQGDTIVFTRTSSGWEEFLLDSGNGVSFRSFIQYTDKVTGIDMVFGGARGGCGNTRIYSGGYNPGIPGKIEWTLNENWMTGHEPAPGDRVMSFAEANGKLYATICGDLYERTDGPNPLWRSVYTIAGANCPCQPGEFGSMRGATAIQKDNGDEDILVALEAWGYIGKIDMINGYTPTVEYRLKKELSWRWWGSNIVYTITSYNDFHPFTIPGTNEEIMLTGFEARCPAVLNNWNEWAPGGWLMTRYKDGTYCIQEIIDNTVRPRPQLVATRTVTTSPFPEDEGKVIYAGGFDTNHRKCRNTGWIYKGTLSTDFTK